MTTPIPFLFQIEPVRYRAQASQFSGRSMNLAALCHQAGIRMRATVPPRTILVHFGISQIRTPTLDVVGVPIEDLGCPQAALRALEALAHSFHDHGARACVCGRDLFCVPAMPDA